MGTKKITFSFCFITLLIFQSAITENEIHPANSIPNSQFYNTPLTQAHAHNDYLHPNPLSDALNYGFTSIEVDVHLIKGTLYVSHDRPIFLNKNKTLTKMYLKPLMERYIANDGKFFQNSNQSISLVIDIKNKKNQTYEAIKTAIAPFHEMLSSWENNEACIKGVNIVLSGKRPIRKVMNEVIRWVQIDGRVQDLGKHYPACLMPTISGHYDEISKPPFLFRKCKHERLANINAIAKKVDAEGKKFRLWKTPENVKTWSALLDKGVDIINSDSLQLLSNFLHERGAQPTYSLQEN